MAHLPKHIQDLVTPFLFHQSLLYYDSIGYSFRIFNLPNEMKISGDLGDQDDVHGVDILNKYHYWFVSFDHFHAEFYSHLNQSIKNFNLYHSKFGFKLNLLHILANSIEHIICHSDSDHYGTYYFLIKVTNIKDEPLNYILPSKMIKDQKKMYLEDFKEISNLKNGIENEDFKEIDFEKDGLEILIFGSELNIREQKDGTYLTISENYGQQIIHVSDEQYHNWDQELEYRKATLMVDQLELKLSKEKMLKYQNTINKYQKQYTPWPKYYNKDDRLCQLAKLLIKTDIKSPEFENYLIEFKSIKNSV